MKYLVTLPTNELFTKTCLMFQSYYSQQAPAPASAPAYGYYHPHQQPPQQPQQPLYDYYDEYSGHPIIHNYHHYMAAPLPLMAPPAPPVHVPPAPLPDHPPVSGGISQVLDYDISTMANFISWCGYGMLKQLRPALAEFKSLLVSVLYATRLSRSTIIVALEYINQRFCSHEISEMLESDIFSKIVTSMVLANKFNDDNTFTNRSWCGATGLLIESLNLEERSWLKEMKWQLSVVLFEHNIRTLEECWSTWLEKYNDSVTPPPSSPLSPYHHRGYSSSSYQPYSPGAYPTSTEDDWSCRGSNVWSYPMYGYNPNVVGYTNPYYGSTAY